MKTKKKILTVLAIVGCAILLVAGSIAGVADSAIYERGIAMLGANCVFAESV